MIDVKKIGWTDSPLKDYIHQAEIDERDDLALADALAKKYNLTPKFFKDIEFRMMWEKNYIIEIYGDTGIGKSTVAQYVGDYTDNFVNSKKMKPLIEKVIDEYGRKPVFDVSNVCFDTSEMIAKIKEIIPFETIVYDEAGSEKAVGTGSSREKADKERILKRVRADQNNFIFCDPLVDNTKLTDLYLYRLRSLDISYKHGFNRSVLEAKNLYGIWGMYGHIITSDFQVKGYREKKNKQIKDIKQFEFGGGRIKLWEKVAGEMIDKGIQKYLFQDWFYLVDEWTKQNYTKDEVKNIIKKIRFRSARPKEEKGKKKNA